ncbi:substrate-binding domain-containing protein [Actinoplanes sp. NPDC023801]|uniref:sugar ABC transporter substrate-binding protein n=1 Tax=Actinoplanes sp. NPDC023801 TaxID=3154595 RepID=UPI0033EE6778
MRYLLAGVVALTATGCTAQAGDDKPVIAVLTPYLANAATKEVVGKFQEAGEKRGWKVTVSDTAGDFSALNSKMQNAANQKVDAIVLGMGDPQQMGLGLEAARSSSVPVFSIDAAVADGIAANVTSDNADLGRKSADALVAAIGGGGRIAMLTHDPHPGVRARTAAAREAFTAAGITVVASEHVAVPGPVEAARKVTDDLLTAHPGQDGLDGIWAAWDEPALGAAQAAEQAKRVDLAVVGVDGQDFALAAIKTGGPFRATVKQDWSAIAERTATLVEDMLKGTQPAQREYTVPGTLVGRTS